jgi:hypothetical protein
MTDEFLHLHDGLSDDGQELGRKGAELRIELGSPDHLAIIAGQKLQRRISHLLRVGKAGKAVPEYKGRGVGYLMLHRGAHDGVNGGMVKVAPASKNLRYTKGGWGQGLDAKQMLNVVKTGLEEGNRKGNVTDDR